MEADRFDGLAKALAREWSRRRVLTGASGGLVAALLGGGALADDCKANGKVCKKDGQCCSGYCQGADPTVNSTAHNTGVCATPCTADQGACTANGDCCSGICQSGTCVETIAGTCSAGANVCTGTGTADCGQGCLCFQTDDGAICAGAGRCITDTDCAACGTGETCVPHSGSCDGCLSALCVAPCTPSGGNFGCFTGETRIAMADGTSKPIALVEVGDAVLGQSGINRVLAVDRPRLGAQPLYALNDGPFFVTANHPFLTATGWKAIDPAAAMTMRPTVAVGQLRVGDRLLALSGVAVPAGARQPAAGEEAAPRLAATALERITAVVADRATHLYDLRVDGDHTYVANDLLVHNK